MSVLGIKESKEAVEFVCKAIAQVREALKDGVGASDVVLVPKLAFGAIVAAKGAEKIPKELADLQPGEFDELVGVAKTSIEDLTPDQYEEAVFLSLGLLKLFVAKEV